eukprot:3043293-Amphidinium_carterae.2
MVWTPQTMGRRLIGFSSQSLCCLLLDLRRPCTTSLTIVWSKCRLTGRRKLKGIMVSPTYYEEPTETDGITIANRYLDAKARHSGAWTYALVARDVEALWLLWCRAAEHALGLP